MAIINSLAIGKSVKSAGNLTYKTVRGRTIASQRITTNKSNTLRQSVQRTHFSLASQAAQLIQLFINNCYDKSKYGSSRNEFMRVNKLFDADGVVSEIREGAIPLADVFVPAFQTVAGGTESKINFSSYGSSTIFVQETVANASFTDSASNSHTYRQSEDVKFTFPVPIAPEKAEVVCVYLGGSAETHLAGAFFKLLTVDLTPTGIAKLDALGFSTTTELDDNGNVISMTVVSSVAPADTIHNYGVVFPRIDGKSPKLRGLLAGGSAE